MVSYLWSVHVQSVLCTISKILMPLGFCLVAEWHFWWLEALHTENGVAVSILILFSLCVETFLVFLTVLRVLKCLELTENSAFTGKMGLLRNSSFCIHFGKI
jgi:hypothetical protein